MDEKIIFGLITIAIGVISYAFYFRDMFRNTTKPEAFSWLIWGILAVITFFAQVLKGGAAGAWATALTAIACLSIAAIAFYRRDGRPKLIDIVSFIGVIAAVLFWFLTADPLYAIILVIFVGALGFVPAFVKAFKAPHEETVATYGLNAMKFIFALLALGSFNLITVLYPLSLALMNILFTGMLLMRRHALTD